MAPRYPRDTHGDGPGGSPTPLSPHIPQRTTYVWREPRLCRGGQSLPAQTVQRCRSDDFWLKIGILAGTWTAVLLAGLAAYFWKKNQK